MEYIRRTSRSDRPDIHCAPVCECAHGTPSHAMSANSSSVSRRVHRLGSENEHLTRFGTFLDINADFFTHGLQDDGNDFLVLILQLRELVTGLTFWDLDVLSSVAIAIHQVEETIFNIDNIIFPSADIGDVHVVSGWGQIFVLLAGEDVKGDQMDLGVTVLASLGCGHVDNLAWSVLDDNETVLSESRTLHGVGGGGASIGGLEREILSIGRHDEGG